MKDTYRVAVAGLIHDHVWGMLRWWKQLDTAQLMAAADPNPPLLERARAEFEIPTSYAAYAEMLDREMPDILMIATSNAETAEIVEAAAARGIHVVSEKPMAATLEQAARMVAAARKHKVQLMINWPTAWNPQIQTIDRLVRAGEIGKVWQVKYRAAHQGPKEIGCSEYFYNWLYDPELNGAGALMDYCCYGADMAAHWLGRPESVVGIRGTLVKEDFPVDDNAIILMKYAGAFGIAEASWTQAATDGGANPSVYGTTGTLSVVNGKVRLARGDQDSQIVEPDPPAPGRRNGAAYMVSCLQSGAPVDGFCSPDTSLIAQEILAGGLRSADTGQEVRL